MTIRHFEIFRAVCDSGGITAAAERLGITQPTVSITIRELEAYYHTKLFDRINRKIYLTEAGILLRQYVDSVLDTCEEAAMTLRNGKSFSKCKLGVNVSFAESHLAGVIKKIKRELPSCDLHITVQNNETLEHLLSDNQIDLAIYDGTNDRTSKHMEIIFKEQMVPVCSNELFSDETICIKKLTEYPLLLREIGSGVRTVIDKVFFSHGLAEQVLIESTSTMSLLSLAEEGLGFVFLPQDIAEKECENRYLKIVSLADEEIYRMYYLAHNEKKHLTDAMLQIKNLLQLNRPKI